MIGGLTRLFPLWAILFSIFAYFSPETFSRLKGLIIPLLMVIMLGMGITLSWEDFKRAFQKPGIIFIGVLFQYIFMPLAAFLLSKSLELSAELTVGMVLVGSVSGGTASNVISYLARGDLALSIAMTTVSTFLAILATPFLTWLYIGRMVPVPVENMLFSILKIVILPVVLGVMINRFFKRAMSAAGPLFPLISVAAIVVIIAIVVALNQPKIATVGRLVVVAVMLHNLIGLAAGFGVSKLLGYDSTVCRTIAIEVGMQNSGLGVALAIQYFSAVSALPGALFSIWHNLSGSLFASYWSSSSKRLPQSEK